jgi:hypothetical protein
MIIDAQISPRTAATTGRSIQRGETLVSVITLISASFLRFC